MKGLKFLSYLLVCMALANCKVTFDDDVIKIDDDEEETYYVGDVEEINYFNGGGLYPAGVPHNQIQLNMRVNAKGIVIADLDTFSCKVSDKISGRTFSRLVNLLEDSATTGEVRPYDNTAIDGTVQKLTITGEDFEEKLYIYGGTPLLVEKDGQKVLAALENIINSLKEKGCGGDVDSEISVLYYRQNLISAADRPMAQGTIEGQAIACPSIGCVKDQLTRDFRISIENGKVTVTGRENRNISNGFCTKSFNNKVINVDLVADINKIKVRQQDVICMIAAPAGMGLEMTLIYNDGHSVTGGEGCWHNSQLYNHNDFNNKFLTWLAKQPEECAVRHY